jgi:hypothetical protein
METDLHPQLPKLFGWGGKIGCYLTLAKLGGLPTQIAKFLVKTSR